jgi:hypothetical protein
MVRTLAGVLLSAFLSASVIQPGDKPLIIDHLEEKPTDN